MKKLLVFLVLAPFAACQDYESPGAVADESVWSHVPEGAGKGEREGSEREQRQRELAVLEERVANLEYRLARVESAVKAQPTTDQDPAVLERARGMLEDVKKDLRTMRDLYDQPEAFEEVRESARDRLDEVDERVQFLAQPADG